MRKLKRAIIFAIVFSFFPFGIMATAGNPPSDYYIDESKLPFDPLPGAVAYWGIHKNAGYRVEVPDDWNGDLVVYCHGYRNIATRTISQTHAQLSKTNIW